jgi:hypothetical protein
MEERELGEPYIGPRGGGEGAAEAVEATVPVAAINGGAARWGQWWGGFGGEEGVRRREWAAAHLRRKGRRRGEAGRRRGKPAAARCGQPWRRPEVGDGPDRWAPPVGGCERERWWEAGVLVGRVGRKRVWAAVGLGEGLLLFFFFFFFLFFKPIFKTNFKSNILHIFKFKF